MEILLRAISDLYRPPLKRFEFVSKDILVYAAEGAVWEICYSARGITFQLSAPARWLGHMKEKALAAWPQASVKEIDRRPLPMPATVMEMKLKQHYFMSLNSSRREASILNSLVPVIRELKEGDEALLQICILPVSDNWRLEAIEAKNGFLRGKIPHRLEFNTRTALYGVGKVLDGICEFINDTIVDLVDAKPAPPDKQLQAHQLARFDPEAQSLILDGGLSPATHNKAQNKGYDVTIRIAAHSLDDFRRRVIMKSISTALQCMNQDNELVTDTPGNQEKVLAAVMKADIPAVKLNKDILSMPELARLIQLPQAMLQAEYPEIEQIFHRRFRLPDCLFTAGGYPLGDVIEAGTRRTAYIQTADHNILCLPHIALGAMGTGKTNGQGARTALGFLQSGFSAVAIDVADGKLIDTIRDGIPEGLIPDDHIIDLDFGDTAWPLPLNWSEITLKLCGGDGDTMESRRAANRLSAQLVDFVSRLSSYDTTDRMQRYLAAAARAELSDPRASLLEPILMLSSEAYRAQRLERVKHPRTYDTLNGLHTLQEGARGQIVQPILDRLEMLLSNEFMANCVLQRQKIDAGGRPLMNFRRWLDGDDRGPYFVGIRVPKEVLLDIATDRMVTFLVAKVWLSALTRYDTPEAQRRPAVFIMDEPHQFMSGKALWGDMVREARKWRLKLVWLAHNFRDFKDLAKTMKDSGCQYSVYRSSKETYVDLLEELAPFSLEELMNIPERWHAVNRITVPDVGVSALAFLAKMMPPPAPVRDRSSRRQECSRLFGQPVEVVEADIFQREQILYKRSPGNMSGHKKGQ